MAGDLVVSDAPPAHLPELGPLLGPLLAPPHGSAPWLDEIRLALLGELFAAAGEARQRAGGGPVGFAVDNWLGAFQRAADRAASRVAEEVDRRVEEAALASRMPARLVTTRRLTEDDRRAIRNRFLSAAIPLERIAETGARADPGVRHVAGALLSAWDRLAAFAADEQGRGLRLAQEVNAWRRPRGPLVAISVGVTLVALATGLMLGGFLPAPGLLARLRDMWWRLPWP